MLAALGSVFGLVTSVVLGNNSINAAVSPALERTSQLFKMWVHKLLLASTALLSEGVFASPTEYGLESRGLTTGTSKCAGYKAGNVKNTRTGVTATLSLIGKGCAVYGEDLKELTLTVDYETGMWSFPSAQLSFTDRFRLPVARQDHRRQKQAIRGAHAPCSASRRWKVQQQGLRL